MPLICACDEPCTCWQSQTFLLIDAHTLRTYGEGAGDPGGRDVVQTEPGWSNDRVVARPMYDDGRDRVSFHISQAAHDHECPDDWTLVSYPSVRAIIHAGAHHRDVRRGLELIRDHLDAVLAASDEEWIHYGDRWRAFHEARRIVSGRE